ncbi:MAG: tRNA pseudouridine(55) synthase TruB [Candidatus Omnitrophica bacterium]|nr:tRNA pseudouridine(55) synthase TruB [Candidatus Omnitrophota bacterium]
MMDGIIIVDKPKGITSHDVVDYVRKKLKVRKVGHAGTLDPIASGLLIILVGSATKLFSKFLELDKVYEATLTLGTKTHTGDIEGRIIQTKPFSSVSRDNLLEIFRRFLGKQMQIPHPFSARHYKGERLYFLSRKGINFSVPAHLIEIKELKLLEFSPPLIKFYLRCSSGTYVRKLAEDIAESLGTVGFISEIKRVQIGPFKLKEANKLEDINQNKIIPLSKLNECFQNY